MNYHWVMGKDGKLDTFDKVLLNRLLVPNVGRLLILHVSI